MEVTGVLPAKLEDMDVCGVVSLLEKWGMNEFTEFVREKQMDGRKITEVTEGIVKLWRPRADAKKFITFILNLKEYPEKYLDSVPKTKLTNDGLKISKETNICVDSQYQTVTVRKTREETNLNVVEEILKKIVPPKSFLYRNQQKRAEKAVTSYLPMDAGTPKKKRFFRLSSYEYPFFDIRLRFSKTEHNTDRGYYSVKSNNRYYIQKTFKKADPKTKYKSLPTTEDTSDKITEDHLYEDLNYNDMLETKEDKKEEVNGNHVAVKPCMVKIQELFQAFRLPFFKRSHETVERETSVERKDNLGNIYENNDSALNMYDSIDVNEDSTTEGRDKQQKLPVEDYLEPVHLNKDYCDVSIKQKEESLLSFIMSYFETRFGVKRETNDTTHSEESDAESRECEEKWDARKPSTNMAARPLPVPVENEPFFMNVDRSEAENLLRGQPDGTFVLRPSSQPNHAYTLSVACVGAVHNVGVRRRPDGRLGLGFARRGERSFGSVASLLRHHRRRRLLLVAAGDVIGATTLNDSPHYYQTPSNVPVINV